MLQLRIKHSGGIEALPVGEVRTKRLLLLYAYSVGMILLRARIECIVQAIPKEIEPHNNGDNG